MGTLLNAATLATLTNNTAYTNTTTYPTAYMNGVLSAVQQSVARYLQYDPTLTAWVNEEGGVTYLGSGAYAGRYLIELRNRPLIPGTASTVFSSLALTYSLSLTLPSTLDLTQVVVDHTGARVFALAPGAVEALMGSGFGRSTSVPPIWATAYLASYTAGFSTGISDPMPPGGGSYGAQAIPADIQYAAALLAQEALAVQTAQNADTTQPYAGILTSIRVGERAQTYRPLGAGGNGSCSLGYGGPLAQQAQAILERYKRSPVAALV